MYNLENKNADLILRHTDGSKEYLTITDLACVVHHTTSGILIYDEIEAIATVAMEYPKENGWTIEFFSARWEDMTIAHSKTKVAEGTIAKDIEKPGINVAGFTRAHLEKYWGPKILELFDKFIFGQTVALINEEVTYYFIDVQRFYSRNGVGYPLY